MTDTRQSHGLILTCDATGVIEAVIADGLHLGAARHVGESFVYLMDAACIGKALRMLADVQAGHTVAGWELNLRVDNHVHALQFAAFQRGQSIFIVGAVQDTEMLRLYEDLARMNNEQITAMRRAVKERAMAAPTFAAPPADLYDDLMRINNELVTLQRELNQKNRELERLNAQKNQVLGMVAHDLRNPLAVILEYCEYLLGASAANLDGDQQEYLREIQNSSRFMLAMVSDLLDLSAIESGRLNLDRRQVDLAKLTQHVLDLLRPPAQRKNMTLRLECAQPAPVVWVDEYKTQQVIINLLSNAVKYSPAGALIVVRLARDGEMAVVEVEDNGQGIPPDELEHIFKPYSRTSVRATGGESSTGLGLTICRRIVEGHGGVIGVTSTVGAGTTFRFTLPLVEAVAPTFDLEPATATAASNLSGLRVLVVEDSAINRKVLVQTLEKLGCLVDAAADGAEAIAAAKQFPYDLVFLDYHLPDATAPALARSLRAVVGKTARLFALTGGIGAEETEACLAAGIEAVLLKPIRAAELQRLLASSAVEPARE